VEGGAGPSAAPARGQSGAGAAGAGAAGAARRGAARRGAMAEQDEKEGKRFLEKRRREEEQKAIIRDVRDALRAEDGEAEQVAAKASISLEQLNENFSRIKSTNVGKFDAEVFNELSMAVTRTVERSAKDVRRMNIPSFLTRLADKHPEREGGGRVDWTDLGRANNHLFNGVFHNSFMFGALDVKPKERKATQRAAPKVTHVEERPVTVEEGRGGSGREAPKQDHHEQMQRLLLKTIKTVAKDNKNEVPMLPLLLNPSSFTQSVENIFEYSFLVKNLSTVSVDKDGETIVNVMDDSSSGDPASKRPKQNVLSFTMKDWSEACKAYNLKSSVLPTRTGGHYDKST
jgi:hypothetical protein